MVCFQSESDTLNLTSFENIRNKTNQKTVRLAHSKTQMFGSSFGVSPYNCYLATRDIQTFCVQMNRPQMTSHSWEKGM